MGSRGSFGGLYYPLLYCGLLSPIFKGLRGDVLQLRRLKRLGLVGIPKAEKVDGEKVGQMEVGWVGRVGWDASLKKGGRDFYEETGGS